MTPALATRLQLLALALALSAWLLGGDGPALLDPDLAYRAWMVPRAGVPLATVLAAVGALGFAAWAGRRQDEALPLRVVLPTALALACLGWLLRPRRPGGDYPGFADLAREAAAPGAPLWAHPTEPGASALHGLVAGQAWHLDPAWLRDGFELPSSVAGLLGLTWVLRRGTALTAGRPWAWLALWLPTGTAAIWWGDAELYAWPLLLTVGMLVEGARAPHDRVAATVSPVLWGSTVALHLLALLAGPAAALLLADHTRRWGTSTLRLSALGLGVAAVVTAELLGVAGATPTSLLETLTGNATAGAWRGAGEAGLGVRLDAFALLVPWGLGGLAAWASRPRPDRTDLLCLLAGAGPALIALVGRSTLSAGGDWNLWAWCLAPLTLGLARRLLLADLPRWVLPAWAALSGATVAPWLLARALT